MYYAIQNEGKETLHFEAGDNICQGIFMKYYVTDDDKPTQTTRKRWTRKYDKGEIKMKEKFYISTAIAYIWKTSYWKYL